MTHPFLVKDLTDMRIRADNIKKNSKDSFRDNIDFYFMQKRAQVWAKKDIKELIKKYKKDQKSENKNISFQISMDCHWHTKKIKILIKSFSLFKRTY